MLGTLAVNVLVTTWERRAGRRLGSEVLIADAGHTLQRRDGERRRHHRPRHRAARLEQADGIVALLVAVVIFRTAWGILRGAAAHVSETLRASPPTKSPPPRVVPGVIELPRSPDQGFGEPRLRRPARPGRPGTTVERGHAIAHEVEAALRRAYGQITDVVVHLEPATADGEPQGAP